MGGAHEPGRGSGAEPVSDSAIISTSLSEPEVFATLVDRHFEPVYRYLARRVGRQVADDLAAECFLVAFRGRRRFDQTHADARPWLYGIATNLVRHHRRRERRRLSAYSRWTPPVEHDEADATVDLLAARSRLQDLARVLRRLDPDHRDVVHLVAVVGLTYEEAAEVLALPVGTVRSRLGRARRRLRELLDQRGQDHECTTASPYDPGGVHDPH